MIRQAVLYLGGPGDVRAALLRVAGRPVAFRALMATLRAGVFRVGVPPIFRGTELERVIAATPAARTATVWLEEGEAFPGEAVLLVPATVLVAAPDLARLASGSPTTVLAKSRAAGAPVLLATPALCHSLWPALVTSTPIGRLLEGFLAVGPVTAMAGGGAFVCVTNEAEGEAAEAFLYARLGSPVDTRLDTAVHRRLSRPVTRRAVAWRITPNQLTLASLAVGVAAVWSLWRAEPMGAVFGLVLYAVSVVLDHADGEVARLTLTESAFGEWLDVAADTVVHALLVLAMGLTVEHAVGEGGAILGAVGAAGVVAGGVLAKVWPPTSAVGGIGALLHGLSNRNGFYALLVAFILALALLPASLPGVMIVAAVGMHAYWLGRVLHRLAGPRPATTAPSE